LCGRLPTKEKIPQKRVKRVGKKTKPKKSGKKPSRHSNQRIESAKNKKEKGAAKKVHGAGEVQFGSLQGVPLKRSIKKNPRAWGEGRKSKVSAETKTAHVPFW